MGRKARGGLKPERLQLKTAIATDKLLADFLATLADRAIIGDDVLPRDEKHYREQIARAKQRIPVVAEALGRTLTQVAEAYAAPAGSLFGPTVRNKAIVPVLAAWRDRLVHPGFLAATPWAQLPHLPRYLRALGKRLEKYQTMPGAKRDMRRCWLTTGATGAPRSIASARLLATLCLDFRWQIEELNVSLFAQELKTPYIRSRQASRQGLAEMRHRRHALGKN